MNFTFVLAFVAVIALPSTSKASTWIDVAGNDAVVVFVDKDSIGRDGPNVRAWLKWVWTKPMEIVNSFPPKYYLLQYQLNVYSCQKRTYSIVQETSYSDVAGNNVVNSYAFDKKDWKFSEPVPDSIGETLQKFACQSALDKSKR